MIRRPPRSTLFPYTRSSDLRKLYNARKCDRATPCAYASKLLLNLVNLLNKWWARLVPAAAVIPAPQVEIMITGSKAFVAGFLNLL